MSSNTMSWWTWRWEHTHAGYWLIHIALIAILTRITLLSFSCTRSYRHATYTHTPTLCCRQTLVYTLILMLLYSHGVLSSLKFLKLYRCSQVLDGLMCKFSEIKETTAAVTPETVQVCMPSPRKVTLLWFYQSRFKGIEFCCCIIVCLFSLTV